MQKIASLFVFLCLLAVLGHVNVANGETVGEHFGKQLERCGDAADDASHGNLFGRSAA